MTTASGDVLRRDVVDPISAPPISAWDVGPVPLAKNLREAQFVFCRLDPTPTGL